MPHYFSRLVATRRLDLELQLTRETPQAWLLGESEHGEALLHIEGHEPLTAFIVAQPRLWNREARSQGMTREIRLHDKQPQQDPPGETSCRYGFCEITHGVRVVRSASLGSIRLAEADSTLS